MAMTGRKIGVTMGVDGAGMAVPVPVDIKSGEPLAGVRTCEVRYDVGVGSTVNIELFIKESCARDEGGDYDFYGRVDDGND